MQSPTLSPTSNQTLLWSHRDFIPFLERQFTRCGVPERYWGTTLENKQLGEPIRDSLYLYGGTGTGKTHEAAKLAKAKIIASTQLYGESQFVNLSKVAMIGVAKLLDNLKKSYNNSGLTEGEIVAHFSTCNLLILDDLGADALSDWGVSKLFDIIDERYANLLPTVITSNYSPRDLFSRLGGSTTAQAIVSRLCTYELRQLEGKDRRL